MVMRAAVRRKTWFDGRACDCLMCVRAAQVDILLANPLRLATLADEGKIDLSHVRSALSACTSTHRLMSGPCVCPRLCLCSAARAYACVHQGSSYQWWPF